MNTERAKIRIYNTFLAHQLLKWAEQMGKQSELELALFESYFSKQENVGDEKVLAEVAGRVGLDEAEADAVQRRSDFTRGFTKLPILIWA